MERTMIIEEIEKMKKETEAKRRDCDNIFTKKYYDGIIDAFDFSLQLLNI